MLDRLKAIYNFSHMKQYDLYGLWWVKKKKKQLNEQNNPDT